MKGTCTRWPVLTALAALLCSGGLLHADDLYDKKAPRGDTVAMPKPSEVQVLAVSPTAVKLRGTDDSVQLVLTGALSGGRQQDLTGDVQYTVAIPGIVRVTTTGRVVPV